MTERRGDEAPDLLVRRQRERRTPFFARYRPPLDHRFGAEARARPLPSRASRAESAGRLPFFLRRWWLRDHVGGETFPKFGGDLHTLPLGSQYSDPFCDAGSADVRVF